MTIMLDKNAADKKADTIQVLQLLFPKYKFTFLPSRTILCNLGETNVIIDENNFTFLQEILKLVFCHKTSSADGFNPANEEARKIAQKLMRGRQRVAAQKQGDNEGSIFSQYISILAVGLGMPLTQLCELTVYQVYDLLERYRLNIAWDLDIRSRLAGGKPDSAPDD